MASQSHHTHTPSHQDDRNNLFAQVAPEHFDLDGWSRHKNPPGSNVVQNAPMAAMTPQSTYATGFPTATPGSSGANGARRHSTASTSQAQGGDSTPGHGNSNAEAPPAWADQKTKAGKDRKRLPLACIACRRKKIRCSGEKPACKHCMKSRTPCVYKVTTRKAAPRTDYMAMLDKRLKRMEERVIKALPKEDFDKLPDVARAVVKPSAAGQQQKAQKKRTADEAFGQQLDRWAGTPENVTPNREARVPSISAEEAREPRRYPPPKLITTEERRALLTDGVEALPSKEIQLHLAEVYFDYVYGQSYHLLHKPSFMRRLEAGNIPPVLTLAVCAVSARFSTHPALKFEPAFLRGEEWAKAALEVALRRFDAPNITILIVFLLLGLHTFGACQGGRSWMLGGMAQRMAYALQLHVDLDHDPLGQAQGQVAELSFTDREIRRRTMWAAFMMDRFNSSGTERPLFASEAGLQLQLPIQEHLFLMEIPGPTELLDGTVSKPIRSVTGQMSNPKDNMGVAAYLVRLVWHWGQLVQYLNLGGKQKDKYRPWEPQSQYQVIMKHIAQWDEGLPDRLRYSSENLGTHASEQTANQFIYMHLIYQQCILFANQFAYPTTARDVSVGVPQADIIRGRKVALDAATRISELIKDATEYRLVAPFAGYCTYSSSAVLIYGAFSRNPQLETASKEGLAHNIIYLSKMKKYWGMFHFMTESLKDLYRQNADALSRGTNTPTTTKAIQKKVMQYGDWYDRYPNGVSQADYEEPEAAVKKEAGEDAVFSQRPDLQSVEDFFATLSPTSRGKYPRGSKKGGKKASVVVNPVQDIDNRSNDPTLEPSIDSIATSNSPYGIPESYSRTPVQARVNPPPPPNPPQISQRQQPQVQPMPSVQGFTQQPQTFDPTVLDPSLDPFAFSPAFFGPGGSHPGMLSQMDRHLVLQSYDGLDHSTTGNSNVPNNMPAPQPQSNHDFWGLNDSYDPYLGLDTGVGGTSGMEMGMGTGTMGGGGAWMMPFNLDPPDFGAGAASGGLDDVFGGFGMGNDPWFGLGSDPTGLVDPALTAQTGGGHEGAGGGA